MNNSIFMKAKFKGICAETGKAVTKGDSILYDKTARKAYCTESSTYKGENQRMQTINYIQAQEDAYFDNFCARNGI